MEINREELKRQARERIADTEPKFWMVALTYVAMTTGISWLLTLIPVPTGSFLQPFFQVLLTLYTAVIQFGMCLWALWTWRQLNPGIGSLVQGFSVAGRVLLMTLGVMIRVVGWYFIIALALGTPVLLLIISGGGAGLGMFSFLLLVVGMVAVVIILKLRYALAPFLLADRPDDGPVMPILRSAVLMRGWKMELFKLELSFLGWEILNAALALAVNLFFLSQAGLLTEAALLAPEWREQMIMVLYSVPAAILSSLVTVPIYLWLLPYRAAARAGFYDARLLLAEREDRFSKMPPL